MDRGDKLTKALKSMTESCLSRTSSRRMLMTPLSVMYPSQAAKVVFSVWNKVGRTSSLMWKYGRCGKKSLPIRKLRSTQSSKTRSRS